MGAGEAAAITATLLARGKRPGLPVVAVENASLPGSRRWVTTLGELPALADGILRRPRGAARRRSVRRCGRVSRVEAGLLEAAAAHLRRAAV